MKSLRIGLICLAALVGSLLTVNTSEANHCGSRVVGVLRVAKNSVVRVAQVRPVKALTKVRPVRTLLFGR